MNLITRDGLITLLQEAARNSSVKLPGEIEFSLDQDSGVLTIGLGDAALGLDGAIGERNMQNDACAFEAWALILKTWLGNQVKKAALTRSGSAPMPEVETALSGGGSGHYMRFLYRLMKFRDACGDWFSVGDPEMEKRAEEFRAFYDRGSLICNMPNKEAQDKSKSGNESRMEGFFERNPGHLGEKKLYRQLPVGVFKGGAHDENAVFTGGRSAIDLWALGDGEIRIYELKTNRKMAGIITELMFYCNLMYDVYVDRRRFEEPPSESDDRGFAVLRGAESIKTVTGVMLTNAIHPLISREVLKAMNRMGGGSVRYRTVRYDWDAKNGTAANVREEFPND